MPMTRKRPLVDPNQYYAYVWRYQDEVVWVGQGKNNRCRPECKSSWGGRPHGLIELLGIHRHEINVEVFPCESQEESVDLERYLIDKLSPVFNTATQRGGWKGMHTEEGLRKIAEAQTGREVSDDVKEGRSIRMLGNQNLLGHTHTEESKQLIANSAKGRKPSETCKTKSSARMFERNRTNPPRKGKVCSDEHRRKLSEAAKRRVKKCT